MKKMFVILALAAFIAGTSGFAFCDDGGDATPQQKGLDQAQQKKGQTGPKSRTYGTGSCPNAGDGVPDGPGWPESDYA
jgi:hypothetical protein